MLVAGGIETQRAANWARIVRTPLLPISRHGGAAEQNYYEELHDVDFKSGFLYRRRVPKEVALSAETGIEYNPYTGNPEKDNDTDPEHDDDNAYARVRMIGKFWRPWIEWEVMPGFYYYWEHDQPEAWGIDVRLSVIYEAFLSGPE